MTNNIAELIDDAPLGAFHIRLIVLCGMVVLIDGYDLISMGMALPTLAKDWGMPPSEFGGAMAAALVGVLFGSAFAGYMADKVGRRWTLIAMLFIASVFMWLCATASSMNELIAYRFATGFGAGGSIPVAVALTSEYAPSRYRYILVLTMYVGAPLGSAVGGFVAPPLIEQFDWPGIFYFGSVLPIVVCIVLALFLPESIKFLTARGKPADVIRRLLTRVRPGVDTSNTAFIVEEAPQQRGPIGELFGERRTQKTLILWVIFFAAQFVLFLVSLWLPTVYEAAGRAPAKALNALGFYNTGAAAGALTIGLLADKFGAPRTLKITFPFAAVALTVLGFTSGSDGLFFSVAFVAGGAAIGSSLCLGPLAASLYPTHARSTGVGWALGIGRAGSIIAPFAGATIVGMGATIESFFLVAAAAPLVCAVGIVLLVRQIGDIEASKDVVAAH